MRFQSKGVVWMVAAATAFGAVGCSIPPSRIGFIEKIGQENRKIARSTRAFHSALAPLKTGQPADAGQVRSAYQEMENTVKEVQAEMDVQALPTSSSSAKSFLSAYKDYLNAEQKILTDDLQPIVNKVAEPGGSPAEKGAFANGMLAKVTADENAAFAPLKKAQDDYASEHNYTVQSIETYFENQKNGKQ
jgi:hypothetical protein